MAIATSLRSPLSWRTNPSPSIPPRLPRLSVARFLDRPFIASRRVAPLGAVAVGGGGLGVEGDGGLEKEVVRTLLIDNYDSYTFNIYQELAVVNGVPPVVVRNDEWTWEYIYHLLYEERSFDNIVISPGPGTPTCPKDIGVCLQVLLHCEDIPILGVCLGHQALGYAHGARVIHAPEPIHGRLSEIEHSGGELFRNVPSGFKSGFKVVRYHSLVIDADSLPKELVPIAWTTSGHTLSFLETQNVGINSAFDFHSSQLAALNYCDQEIKTEQVPRSGSTSNLINRSIVMGVKHSDWPHYGVQFHPESVATHFGRQIFENFKKITRDYGARTSLKHKRQVSHACQPFEGIPKNNALSTKAYMRFLSETAMLAPKGIGLQLRLQWKKIDGLLGQTGGSENIFLKLFGDHKADDTFWLDSSSTDKGRARFSFMGGKGGSLWKQLTFRLAGGRNCQIGHGNSNLSSKVGGYLTTRDSHGSATTTFLEDGFFDFMNKELQSFHYDKNDYEGLPFDFFGGFVGYLGYGLKVECGASFNCHNSKAPDACFFFADNLVVADHWTGDVYILSLNDYSWIIETEQKLLSLKGASTNKLNKQQSLIVNPSPQNRSFTVVKTRNQYIDDVQKCLQLIRDGESYELCLTTQMKKTADHINNLVLYLKLRNKNPAPYAAWLNFTEEELCICCSSPERFLRLDRNDILEAKPIKGTIARGKTQEEDEHLRLQLKYSEKDQAENLMIVDLLRNDLGQVCEPGSVCVPRLMDVESYATVHTLVSTIQGKRKPNVTPIECVRAAFPGGSMTGAPKIRSMELLDSIESCSRGIYSGCIGFFSYNQAFDLNIVIRTVVLHEGEASVGAGGAIVALSKPEDEYAEMLLKAGAPTKAVEECLMNLESFRKSVQTVV